MDLHVHTKGSPDALGSLKEISRWARLKGIDAVAVTDHDRATLSRPMVIDSVTFIPGVEVKTEQGHILGIGLRNSTDDEMMRVDPIGAIKEAGGICVLAHPFDHYSRRMEDEPKGIDVIEVMNSSTMFFRYNFRLARAYAEKWGLPETAGSDSHMPKTVGDALVEVDGEDVDDALASIVKGKGRVVGRPTSIIKRVELNLLRIGKGKVRFLLP